MILYSLVCERDHAFEAWFPDSAAYDRQAATRAVTCPQCGSAKVEKAVMAPRIGKRKAKEEEKPLTHISGHDAKLGRLLQELREHVEENYDYVGERFAEEARRIHHGEVETRNIYGEATTEDVRALKDEGVPVAPLPALPRRND
jgi:hypothetical protein